VRYGQKSCDCIPGDLDEGGVSFLGARVRSNLFVELGLRVFEEGQRVSDVACPRLDSITTGLVKQCPRIVIQLRRR